MAYEKGSVSEVLEPRILIEFEIGKKLEFVIDTGFNGSLCLPRSLMSEFGLVKVSEEEIYGIGNFRDTLDLSTAEILWFGELLEVDVVINEGDDCLLGSELLHDKILNIDYKYKTVTISN